MSTDNHGIRLEAAPPPGGVANRIIKQIAKHDAKKISVPAHNRQIGMHLSGPQIASIGSRLGRYCRNAFDYQIR